MLQVLSEKHNSFLRPLKKKGFKEARVTTIEQGIRDLVMELCCALNNFRVRLTPWQPMV